MAFPIELIPLVDDYAATGSRVMCYPPPMDTDEDWIVLVSGYQHAKNLEKTLLEQGWTTDGKNYADDFKKRHNNFKSFRKDDINLIVTPDHIMFDHYVLATRIGTVLNIQEKPKRIALFAMIRDYAPRRYGGAF